MDALSPHAFVERSPFNHAETRMGRRGSILLLVGLGALCLFDIALFVLVWKAPAVALWWSAIRAMPGGALTAIGQPVAAFLAGLATRKPLLIGTALLSGLIASGSAVMVTLTVGLVLVAALNLSRRPAQTF